MSNYSLTVRVKRWAKYFINYIKEKQQGLDFSMVYVGDLQRNTTEYHGYSMTDEGDLKKMLLSIPIDPSKAFFLDIGCGKGMCLKCAAELGYKRVAGIDLDNKLLNIAQKNMSKLKIDAQCVYANAEDYADYAEFDVFYFYNPFGEKIFQQVITRILESQYVRNRDIWIIYYHPVFGELFCESGFILHDKIQDSTRDTTANVYYLPIRK